MVGEKAAGGGRRAAGGGRRRPQLKTGAVWPPYDLRRRRVVAGENSVEIHADGAAAKMKRKVCGEVRLSSRRLRPDKNVSRLCNDARLKITNLNKFLIECVRYLSTPGINIQHLIEIRAGEADRVVSGGLHAA
ncbi:hypothetical protein EVAR_102563_1 [Eumeta japonica]|uniref:Uncharacterized protein n=1 Tax=Eumeta variegata TaxID=151549 RepID=A0A4C2A2F0_EUMVA|nr:hypothetical protein EVAR_102563_1 [Eumeta japonica]